MSAPLPIGARVAILGAGCAGLMVAERLRDHGYRHLTIFEAAPHAGGKIRTLPYDGPRRGGRGLFEAGTVFFIPGPAWRLLLARYAVPDRCVAMPVVRIADLENGVVCRPLAYANGHSLLARLRETAAFLRLNRRYGPAHDRVPGLAAHVTDDLAEPAGAWFTSQGLSFVREVLLPVVGAAQYGPLVDRVPALYVVRLLSALRRYPLLSQLRLRLPQLAAGHQTVWSRLAATHDVHLAEPVRRLVRSEDVRIETHAGSYTFDAVVVATPVDRYLEYAGADATPEERDLFARVRTLDRTIITARVEGLPAGVFYVPRYGRDGVVPPGHPHLFYEVDPGSGLYTFHPYLDGGCTLDDTERAVAAVVARLGGRLVEIVHRAVVRGWFPHFGGDDLRAGAYARLERLQGARRTWFVGELFAGVTVPHGTEYACAVADAMAFGNGPTAPAKAPSAR